MIKASFVSLMAAVALGAVPQPAAAQDWSIRVVLDGGDIRGWIGYRTRHEYRVRRTHVCEQDGPYLYCWEPAHRRHAPVVVYVHEPVIVVRGHPGRAHARGHWRRAEKERRRMRERAERAYWRWYEAQGRGRYDRDRVEIRVVWD
jgi:hypothetical protein